MSKERICENCEAWERDGGGSEGVFMTGSCMLKPPVKLEFDIDALYPETGNSDRCMEFIKKGSV